MRLAPIPIFFSSSPVEEAMARARQSSETTHPGHLASRAAEFMAFCIHRAINCERRIAGSDALLSSGKFLDIIVDEYLRKYCSEVSLLFLSLIKVFILVVDFCLDLKLRPGNRELRRLLLSQEPSHSKEYSWNWRLEKLPIMECMKTRYNFVIVSVICF